MLLSLIFFLSNKLTSTTQEVISFIIQAVTKKEKKRQKTVCQTFFKKPNIKLCRKCKCEEGFVKFNKLL